MNLEPWTLYMKNQLSSSGSCTRQWASSMGVYKTWARSWPGPWPTLWPTPWSTTNFVTLPIVTLHGKTGKKVNTRTRVWWHSTLSVSLVSQICTYVISKTKSVTVDIVLHAKPFLQSSQLFNTLNVPKDTRVKRPACNICSKQEIFQVWKGIGNGNFWHK